MHPNHLIRVLIVHGDPIARVGLSATLGRYPDIEVVDADASDADAPAPGRSAARPADVVVADYEHGVAFAEARASRATDHKSVKVVIVASTVREWEIRSALERGARGYLLVGCGLEELACGVRAVHRGVRYLSAPVAQRLADIMAGEPLTAREEEVLRLLVEGLGNKSIARHLNIAVGTVKSHLKAVFGKLGVGSRAQAICVVERRGLLRGLAHVDPGTTSAQSVPVSPFRYLEPGHDRGNDNHSADGIRAVPAGS